MDKARIKPCLSATQRDAGEASSDILFRLPPELRNRVYEYYAEDIDVRISTDGRTSTVPLVRV